MRESSESLKSEMDDREFRHAYARSFMNSSIAAQIKVIREQRDMTQVELAEAIGTKQAGISRLENVNYDGWKVGTLSKIAEAYDVRLKITFEEFSTLEPEIDSYSRANLQRDSYEEGKKRARTPEMNEVVSDLLNATRWITAGPANLSFGGQSLEVSYGYVTTQTSSSVLCQIVEENIHAQRIQ